jgi:sec-independent protein translocase protein TatA
MSEWVIVAVVGVVLLFGAKKLPDMARGLGQSMRIFKAETRGLKEDDERTAPRPAESSAPPATPPGGASADAGAADGAPAVRGTAPDGSRLPE